MTLSSVSVIIPNYNGEKLLARYLPCAIDACKQSTAVSDYEIIVADDCSTDNSVSFLQQCFPEVTVIQSQQNKGFSVTINKGIAAASKELVLLLNNDMQISHEFFDTLIPLFQPDTFGINCAITDPATGEIQEGRKKLTIRNAKIHYTDDLSVCGVGNTLYLCGGNALINREKINLLRGFDEIYSPFYFEDMDICLRAWRKGWNSLYSSKVTTMHQHSATINTNFTPQYVRYIFIRNRIILNYRFLPFITRLRLRIYFHCLQEIVTSKKYRPYCDALALIRAKAVERMPLQKRWFYFGCIDLADVIQ